jgi:hypothetical protein
VAPHHTCCCRALQAEQSIEASFLSEAEMVFATLSSTQVGGAGVALVAGGAAAVRTVQDWPSSLSANELGAWTVR